MNNIYIHINKVDKIMNQAHFAFLNMYRNLTILFYRFIKRNGMLNDRTVEQGS